MSKRSRGAERRVAALVSLGRVPVEEGMELEALKPLASRPRSGGPQRDDLEALHLPHVGTARRHALEITQDLTEARELAGEKHLALF